MAHALTCDTYLLTVAQGLFNQGRHLQPAVSYCFTRRPAFNANASCIVGLEQLINTLRQWCFENKDLDYLSNLRYANATPRFTEEFLRMLQELRFSGELYAVPEGTWLQANAPILTLQAPIILCQLLETICINTFNLPSLVASKTARICQATGTTNAVAEFGLRRSHSPEAGLWASRAAYIGGAAATSNTQAGQEFGIPVTGTVSHSWILSFTSEAAAFDATAELMGNNTVLLVDTYQTSTGVEQAIAAAKRMQAQGLKLQAIRLDSGDLNSLSHLARQMLDAAELQSVKIMASGDLDEQSIKQLKQQQAPIDLWGVGTRLVTAYEQPALDIAFKLSAIKNADGWQYKQKHSDSPGKATLPGKPQVWRQRDADGNIIDTIFDALSENSEQLAQPGQLLLQPIHQQGKWLQKTAKLTDVRAYAKEQQLLLHNPETTQLKLSKKLQELKEIL